MLVVTAIETILRRKSLLKRSDALSLASLANQRMLLGLSLFFLDQLSSQVASYQRSLCSIFMISYLCSHDWVDRLFVG